MIAAVLGWALVTDLARRGDSRGGDLQGVAIQHARLLPVGSEPVTERDWVDANLVDAAWEIHADDPAFGYRFIGRLTPGDSITAGENRVQFLCKDHCICGRCSPKARISSARRRQDC